MSEEILRYPLEKILESLGSQKGSAKNMWMSPFRQENNASLHVDPAKNVWYDHGAGIGGSSIQLVMFAKHCSAKEAVNYIASLSPALANEIRSEESSEPSIEIKKVEPLTSGYLTRYVESRKIPLNLARIYQQHGCIRPQCAKRIQANYQSGHHYHQYRRKDVRIAQFQARSHLRGIL